MSYLKSNGRLFGVFLGGFIFTLNLLYAQHPYDNDLVLRLSFEGNTSGSNGTQLNGVANGNPTYVDGFSGRAIDFRSGGARQFVNMGNTSQLDFDHRDNFTFMIWVKTNTADNSNPYILSNMDSRDMENEGWAFYALEGAWAWNMGFGSERLFYEPTKKHNPVNDGKWHQLAFSYNAALYEIRIYYDGKNVAVYSVGGFAPTGFQSNLPICVGTDGRGSNSNTDQFSGSVDELVAWDRVLEDQEIRLLYEEHFPYYHTTHQLNVNEFTVLNWNIWFGGNETVYGVERVVELIEAVNPDIILMQETYRSGSYIASELGYTLFLAGCNPTGRGSNLSVMSRFPMGRHYMVEERSAWGRNFAFDNGGVHIHLNGRDKINAFTNWYRSDLASELETVMTAWNPLIAISDSIPFITGGDYNSNSHLDGGGSSGHSRAMTDDGFTDSYREMNPDVNAFPGFSSPGGTSRIDYIYYLGQNIQATESDLLWDFQGRGSTPNQYPSDHGAFLTKFEIQNFTPIHSIEGKNPISEKAHIDINIEGNTLIFKGELSNQMKTIHIYDVHGKMVLEKYLQMGSNELQLKPNLKSGIYFVKVTGENGRGYAEDTMANFIVLPWDS